MRADVNGSGRTDRTNAVLPRQHSPDISAQVFIANWRDVVKSDLIPAQRRSVRAEDALVVALLPRIHDHGGAVSQFPENQAMN